MDSLYNYNGLLYISSTTRGDKMENSAVNEKWISLEEAAEHLGIKPVTIRSWIRNNKDIPAHKIGKQWKFKRSELDAWVKSGKSAIE